MQSQTNFGQAHASTTTAQASSDAPMMLPNCKFPVVSTVHEALQSHHKPNPSKGMARPLKTMTNEEKKQHPKTRKKNIWWQSFIISEHEKLGGKSGNIEEGRFLNVWKDHLDDNDSLTTLRDAIRNKK